MCYFSTHQSIYLSCLPACLSACLPACLSIRSVYSICLFDLSIRAAYSIRLFNLSPTINTRAGVIFQYTNHLSTLPFYPIYLSNLPIQSAYQSAYSICLLNLPINLPINLHTQSAYSM